MINSDNITLIEQPIIDFVDKILTEAVDRRASELMLLLGKILETKRELIIQKK